MKYEFTGKTKVHLCITLKQIRATENFGVVVKGDIGGWIQSEANLDVYGNAWVYGDALVSGDARVSGDAEVSGNARVYGDALVSGDARVYGNALVSGDAEVSGDAWVSGNAQVYGDARVQLQSDYFCAQGVGSEFGTLTAFRCEVGIKVSRGCFLGTLDEFRAAVREKHGEDSKVGRSYLGLSNWIEHWFSDAARGE
jgi:carbonic anhydrase/acetyltransferase-like protein (isoleucine patch superfamily)